MKLALVQENVLQLEDFDRRQVSSVFNLTIDRCYCQGEDGAGLTCNSLGAGQELRPLQTASSSSGLHHSATGE